MQELEELDKRCKDKMFRIVSLFFADDGILLTGIVEETEQVKNSMGNVGRDLGLDFNRGK